MEKIILLALLVVYVILGLKKPGIALITSPFVAGAILVIGIASEDLIIAGIGPAMFFATLIAACSSKQEYEAMELPRSIVKIILVSMMFALLLFSAVLCLYIALEQEELLPLIIFIGLIALIASMVGLQFIFASASNSSTAAYVLSTIGSSMRQNLPLPMALESAVIDQSDKRSKILQNIKKWLVQGYPLSESIKRGFPRCPGYAVAMMTAAERMNQLPFALEAIEANISAQTRENRKIRPVHPMYPLIVMMLMFFIILGTMVYIMPQFSNVLEEMFEQQNLPVITRVFIEIMEFIVYKYGWLFGILSLLFIFFAIPAFIYFKFRARRPDQPYLFSRLGDFIKWHLPVLHWFERNYSMVQVVEMLRLSLNAGCPVNVAIDNTLGLDVNNRFKKRLRSWHQKVERGDHISAAARKSRLGSALAWAFDEQVNQGNTLTILETLEAFYRSNYSYCVNLARFVIWPCIILCMGIIVGFVVLAIFSPSVSIITQLVSSVTP